MSFEINSKYADYVELASNYCKENRLNELDNALSYAVASVVENTDNWLDAQGIEDAEFREYLKTVAALVISNMKTAEIVSIQPLRAVEGDVSNLVHTRVGSAQDLVPQIDVSLEMHTVQSQVLSLDLGIDKNKCFTISALKDCVQLLPGWKAQMPTPKELAIKISMDLDKEVLKSFIDIAEGDTIWKRTPPAGVDVNDYLSTLEDRFIIMSNTLFTKTLRAEGNFIIAGENVLSCIESLGDRFTASEVQDKSGFYKAGELSDRWRVFKNPYMDPDEFILGYGGKTYLERCLLLAPYLPLFLIKDGFGSSYAIEPLHLEFCMKGRIID